MFAESERALKWITISINIKICFTFHFIFNSRGFLIQEFEVYFILFYLLLLKIIMDTFNSNLEIYYEVWMELYLNVHHSIKQLSVNLCVAVSILVVGLFLYPVIDPPFPKVLEILYLYFFSYFSSQVWCMFIMNWKINRPMYAWEVPVSLYCTQRVNRRNSVLVAFYCQKMNKFQGEQKMLKNLLKTTEHMQITFELALCGFNNCLSDYE